jgi:hypothetical protein
MSLNQALKHSDALIMSSFIRALLSVTKSLVELNAHSYSILIVGIDGPLKALRGFLSAYKLTLSAPMSVNAD